MRVGFFTRKTLRLIISLFIFTILLYGLLYLSTGDPAVSVLRKLGNQQITQQALTKTRSSLGLDGTFITQYFNWLGQLLKGDFGVSFMTGDSVLKTIALQGVVTFKIIGYSFLFNFLFSISFGTWIANHSVLKKGRSLLTVILSFPSYWTSIVVIFIFGVQLKWFPFVGSSDFKHLILPLVVCFLSEGLYLTKMVSDLLSLTVLSQQQQIAKRRGLSWSVRWFYQVNENIIALISLYATSLIHLFSVTVMIEVIFSISGIGKLLIDAISVRDYPIIQGVSLLIAGMVFLINYLSDLIVLLVDKRVSLEQGEQR